MAKFRFAVSGHFLDLLTPTRGVEDNLYINTAEFDFRSPEWEGAEKWAHFSSPDYENGMVFDFNLIDDKIAGERGLNLTAGMWEVYVHGEVIENEEVFRRLVTTTQTIYIETSNVVNGEPLGSLPISVAEQIDAKATAALNARITAATADIDDTIGTPSVEVDISGEDRTKSLDFHFHGLKGETGEKGDTGDSGVYIGTTAPTDPVKNVWINPEGDAGKVITRYEASGTHQPGTYDTLKLYFSDGTDLTIPVYNGADGSGIGDMIKSVYDTHNKAEDIFDYADGIKDTTANSGLLKGSNGAIVPAVAGTDYQEPLVAGTDYQEPLQFDSVPTESSTKMLTSGAVYTALSEKADRSDIPVPDNAMSDSSENSVQNKVIKSYVDANAGKPFIATYGTTTYAEIAAAVNAGKEVILVDGVRYSVLTFFTASVAEFLGITLGDGNSITATTRMVDANDLWSRYNNGPITAGGPVLSSIVPTAGNPVNSTAVKSYVDSAILTGISYTNYLAPSDITLPAGMGRTITIPAVRSGWKLFGIIGVSINPNLGTSLIDFNAAIVNGTDQNVLVVNIRNDSASSITVHTYDVCVTALFVKSA